MKKVLHFPEINGIATFLKSALRRLHCQKHVALMIQAPFIHIILRPRQMWLLFLPAFLRLRP